MFERIEETSTHLGHCSGTLPGGGRFRVFDHGAHVTEWTPTDTPVIFTSAEARYAPDSAIRGGIPICFPWFAGGREGNRRPAHGVARMARWHLDKLFEAKGVTTLEWRLTEEATHGVPGADLTPRTFEVTCRQHFGTTLKIDLQVRNTGEDSFSFEAALHTYFHVGDVERVTLDGLGGCDYFDKVTHETDTQRDGVTFTGETDRVYASCGDVTIDDPALNRTITVAKQGSATTIVWNPWADRAREFPDMGDNEWRRFVCVETANAGADAIHLAAGETHVMRLRVSTRTR